MTTLPNFSNLSSILPETFPYLLYESSNAIENNELFLLENLKPQPALKLPVNSKKRNTYRKYSTAQVEVLQANYAQNPYLTQENRRFLSVVTGLTEKQIKVWFQNRRARDRKKMRKQTVQEELSPNNNDTYNTILQNLDVDFFNPQTTQDWLLCPHEYFHGTSLQCPCAAT